MILSGPPNVAKLMAKGKIRALIKALDYRKAPEIRRQAAAALRDLGARESVSILIKALADEDGGVRLEAAAALAVLGDPAAAAPLLETLEKAPTQERSCLIKAVAAFPSESVSKALLALRDSDPESRTEAILGLVRLKDPRVLEPLTTDHHPLMEETFQALRASGEEALPLLVSALRGADKYDELLRLMVQLGDLASEPLAEVLSHRDSTFRKDAYSCLGMIRGHKAGRILVSALRHEDPARRGEALLGLAESGHPRAAQAIRLAFQDPHVEVQRKAIAAAKVVRDVGLASDMTRFLEDPGSPLGPDAVGALEVIGGKEAALLLAGVLKQSGTKGFRTRGPAASALSRLPISNLGEFFSGFVTDPDPEVRKTALAALENLKPASALPLLERALQDQDASVRRVAAETLERMGLTPVSPEAQAWLHITMGRWGALESLGDAALNPLIQILEQGFMFERTAAALDRIGWSPPMEHPLAIRFLMETGRLDDCVRAGRELAPRLADFLASSTGKVCANAARALGAIRQPSTVTAICNRLDRMNFYNSEDHETAFALIEALGRIGSPEAIAFLGGLVSFPHISSWGRSKETVNKVKGFAMQTLAGSGAPAVRHLLSSLTLGDFDLRFLAEKALEEICRSHREEAALTLIETLGSRLLVERRYAAQKLVEYYSSGLVDERVRAKIFEQRERIAAAHTDRGANTPHDDGIRAVEGWCKKHVDTPATRHQDAGIGVAFPEDDPLYGRTESLAPTSIPPIEEILAQMDRCDDEAGRARALGLLARSKSPEAIHRIVSALQDPDWPVRAAAVRALGQRRDSGAEEWLMARLEDTAWQVRQDALGALDRIGAQPQGPDRKMLVWRARMESIDPGLRRRTAGELGACGIPGTAGILADALEDPEPTVRMAVVRALGALGAREAAPRLVNALSDANPEVRKTAASTLEELQWKPGDDVRETLRYHLLRNERSACASLGSAAIAPLVEILHEEDPELCRQAVQILGEINVPEAVEPLLSAMERNPDSDVRTAAVQALAKHEGPRVTIGLRRVLDRDPEIEVRRAAAETLTAVAATLEARLPARYLKTERDLDTCQSILKLLEKLEIVETWEILLDVHQACARLRNDLDGVDNWAEKVKLAQDRIGSAPLAGVRAEAEKLLREVAGMEREHVRAKLKTEIAGFESCIVEIFRAKGTQALNELEKAVENPSNSTTGAAAIQMLGALRGDSANRILARAVRMDGLRDIASQALITNADLGAAQYLVELLPPLTPERTRDAAVRILEALRWAPQTEEQALCLAIAKGDWNRCIQAGGQAVPWLAQALNHPESSWEEQRSVAETLATIGGQEAIRILDGQLTWPSLARRTAIISALPKLDAQEAINRLLAILTDPQRYPDCRQTAIMSLKQIYLDAPITIGEHIRALGRTILRHGDTSAVPHQDTRTPRPGHQDYGGGKCIFPHTDIGSTHKDVHARAHADTGLSRDFPL